MLIVLVKETVILSVDPVFGPKSGGTPVEIVGIHLNATDGPSVFLDNNICPLVNK